jgi:hypothetical protein
LLFVETVSGNKQGFMKRQIKGADAAWALYATLSYPSLKDYKWVIRSNQIKDCPVTVQGVDVAHTIWGKNIAALKGKTIRSTPDPVARDFVKVLPVELMNLHREVFLTVDIFFVNKIPFFLTLSRRICFTAVNHLADRTVPQIFKAFKVIESIEEYLGGRWSSGVPSGVRKCANDDGGLWGLYRAGDQEHPGLCRRTHSSRH